MNDQEREEAIQRAKVDMLRAKPGSKAQRQAGKRFTALINGRSPERNRELAAAKGLPFNESAAL